jgi:hypothetical protein
VLSPTYLRDLASTEACDRNSLSSKLSCLIFKLTFGNRSLWGPAQISGYDTYVAWGCNSLKAMSLVRLGGDILDWQ